MFLIFLAVIKWIYIIKPNSVTQLKLKFSKNIISMIECIPPETFTYF